MKFFSNTDKIFKLILKVYLKFFRGCWGKTWHDILQYVSYTLQHQYNMDAGVQGSWLR